MKYYIIAGEASGDLHGSNLMKGIYAQDPEAQIRFWGGDLMRSVWDVFQNDPSHSDGVGPSPCSQGDSMVLSTSPHHAHQVAAPEADLGFRVLRINSLHQVRAVKVT